MLCQQSYGTKVLNYDTHKYAILNDKYLESVNCLYIIHIQITSDFGPLLAAELAAAAAAAAAEPGGPP